MSDRDGRPNPDALLRQAGKAGRGRLKIFLGAAPGVGKTFEMLQTAQAKHRDGVDVVVAVVETHGRLETQALLAGLEVLPRRDVEYRGRTLREMDLDAILARRPGLVLVDELAHSNAPGSRHPKRYLDVEELLEAGVDVFTTLNIQHVESLNDVVAQITRIRVRETVPDSVIDAADDVEVIDLTPDDLLQRLREGKVYVPQQAERAIQNYFSAGNLTALRELALRRTAQRVDDQMVDYMRARAIAGPWAAGERVLAVVDGTPGSAALVRHAKRLADRLRAPWMALHVETAASTSEAARTQIADALRLAQKLDGDAMTIPGEDVAGTVVEYARANNVTHLVIGRGRRWRWTDLGRESVMGRIIRAADGFSVHVIADRQDKAGEEPARSPPDAAPGPADGRAALAYAGSAAAVAAALGVALVLHRFVTGAGATLVFLTAVLLSAVTWGLWPSLLACLLSVLAYNFFFLPPLYTFTIADPENVVALFFFAIVAVVASNLTARVRAQAITARGRARITEDLYQFSRKLAGAASLDDVLWATAHQIALMLRVHVVLLLPGENGLEVQAGFPPEDVLDEADLAAANWTWSNNQAAGRGADTLPGAKRLFLPMQTGRGPAGVIGIDNDEPGPLLTPDQRRLLNALADQAGVAIERINLMRDVDRARLEAESDRLRSALLTSISHDLRTPLASIMGSASSLASADVRLDEPAKRELARTIEEEAERLNRFIGNLLDMTRLESGPIAPSKALTDLSDAVGSALQRAVKILGNHPVAVDLQPDLPMLSVDEVLMDQVLFNLLDNAAKYAPAGSAIELSAWREDSWVFVRLRDEGPGVPQADLERIFNKFYRAGGADTGRAGTGLGLAICRGFVEAMGGTITASNRTDRTGAAFTIKLPVPAEAGLLARETASAS